MDNNTASSNFLDPCIVGQAVLRSGCALQTTQNLVPAIGDYLGRYVSRITPLSYATATSALVDVALEKVGFNDPVTHMFVGTCLSAAVSIPFGVSIPHAMGSYLLYRTVYKAAELSFICIYDLQQCIKRSFSRDQSEALRV